MNGFWIMLGLVALAIGIGFYGFSQRYQMEGADTGTGYAFRLDSMSGQVCTYFAGDTNFEACAPPCE